MSSTIAVSPLETEKGLRGSPLKRFLKRIYASVVPSEFAVFPEIDTDLIECKELLKGRVLNAGAGWRDVSHLVDGELINQDITWPGDERTNIDIQSPLHKIPLESNYFDAILCIAVLEHVENPDTLMNFLAAIHFKFLIISTPEREIIRGRGDYGPPENTAHYREWNAAEFENYVQGWFTIKKHHIVNDKSISQVVICIKSPV